MLNQHNIIGRLGKEPESRTFENGTAFCNFSVATTEKYKDKSGEMVEATEWHNVALFGRLAEIAQQYLSKGTLVFISGKSQTRSWDDKEGNKRYTTEIVGRELKMLSGKQEVKPTQKLEPTQENKGTLDITDDLPF